MEGGTSSVGDEDVFGKQMQEWMKEDEGGGCDMGLLSGFSLACLICE